jgi:hypothetical protein
MNKQKQQFIFMIMLALLGLRKDVSAQDDYVGHYLEYKNKIYNEQIKSCRIYPANLEASFPLIRLGEEQKLVLEFDWLNNARQTFYYSIQHCSSNWEPTNISPSDYIDGYREEEISDAVGSYNTIISYYHYKLVFPTDVMKITRSGNYIIKVFDPANPDSPYITRRFHVLDEKIGVTANTHPATINEFRFYKQEVDFAIFNPEYEIPDPYGKLKVVVLQNDRWDNAITDLKPAFVKPSELVYDEDEKNVFNGGRDFRQFDLKNLVQTQMNKINYVEVDSIKQTHVYLLTEQKRTFLRYTLERDMNGRYYPSCRACNNPDTDAEYLWVHFFLESAEPVENGDVYVWGGFSDFQCLPENKMVYNPNLPGYVGKTLLKQGYYNYEYVFKKNGSQVVDDFQFEGSRTETENEYCILIYHEPIGSFHEQLIGYGRFGSNNSR